MNLRPEGTIGLVCSGGGARGAYQAGCLRAIADILETDSIPFDIITGVSAGAINAGYLAAFYGPFREATSTLNKFWTELAFSSVINTTPATISKIAAEWISDLSFGGLRTETRIKALVSTKPLGKLLADNLHVSEIKKNIDTGRLQAFAVTATDYETCQNITFVQSNQPERGWQKSARSSRFEDISLEHILASAAIPILFPPVKIGENSFGDGMLRNTAPLSAAIHLGSSKIMTIGARTATPHRARHGIRPTAARVISVMINSAMLDSVDLDIERLTLINELMQGGCQSGRALGLRHIDHLYLRPSEDIGQIAAKHEHLLPGSLRYLLRGLGTPEESAELVSYLLFAGEYCQALSDLGQRDTLERADELKEFFARK